MYNVCLYRNIYITGAAYWLGQVAMLPAASLPLLSEVSLHHSSHLTSGVPDGRPGGTMHVHAHINCYMYSCVRSLTYASYIFPHVYIHSIQLQGGKGITPVYMYKLQQTKINVHYNLMLIGAIRESGIPAHSAHTQSTTAGRGWRIWQTNIAATVHDSLVLLEKVVFLLSRFVSSLPVSRGRVYTPTRPRLRGSVLWRT